MAILSPNERISAWRRACRFGYRECAAILNTAATVLVNAELHGLPVPRHVIAQLDAWEAAGIEIGRPVPKITYTRGWPFDGERRKR